METQSCLCFHRFTPKKIALYSCVEEYTKCPKYDENGNRIHGMSSKCKLCINLCITKEISHFHCSICKKKVYIKFYPENKIYHQGIKCGGYVNGV